MAVSRRTLVLATVLALSTLSTAQTCYWPDGSQQKTSDGIPCSQSNAGQHGGTTNSLNTCCPPGWQCSDNGLCANPQADSIGDAHAGSGLYGRYGCTDQSWDNCLSACTDGESRIGAQAVLQCQTGIWCCDRDRQSGDCCNGDIHNTPSYFSLDNEGGFSPAGGDSAGSSSSASPSDSSPRSTSTEPLTTPISSSTSEDQGSTSQDTGNSQSTFPPSSVIVTTTRGSQASTQQSLSTVTSGSRSGQVVSVQATNTRDGTQVVTETAQSSSPGLSTAEEAGIGVGAGVGGLLIIAIILLAWLLLRRRRRRDNSAAEYEAGETDERYKYAGKQELDGSPVAPVGAGKSDAWTSNRPPADNAAELPGSSPNSPPPRYGQYTDAHELAGNEPVTRRNDAEIT